MPFSAAFGDRPFIKRALSARRHPIAAYGLAVGLVALATLLRWAVGGYAMEGTPFITYYTAIIVATLVGGFWPGVLSTALSAVGAWYFFLPRVGDFDIGQREAVSLLLFVVVSIVNVIVVALLNAAFEHVTAQEENTRVIIESAPNGVIVVDRRGTITLVNEAVEKLFGYAREELVGQSIDVLVPHERLDAHRTARKSYLLRPEKRTFRDLSARRKDGTEFPVDIGLDPLRRNGNIGVLATVIDISERKQVQNSQHLIIRELQHRTQNLFAVFQALASRSLDEGETLAETKSVLNGRLQALARAYAMLANADWKGAPLAEILAREFAGFPRRVTVSGCDIVVSPSAAQQFALITHELATNALKYGALSTPDGRVLVEGKIERREGGGVFSFQWTEIAGPSVVQPTRRGFGSVILLDSAQHFAETVEMNFDSRGLHYRLRLNLEAIGALDSRARRASGALSQSTT